MSTIVTARGPQPFTYEDLDAMPDDGCKREVIGGSLVVSPAPNRGHQRCVVLLVAALFNAETPETRVMVAPFDWRQAEGGAVQPDVMVIRRTDFHNLADRLDAMRTPLLVVEVLSPSNISYDRTLKRELYESLGVPAYWMVDPLAPSIVALRLTDGRYETEAEVDTGAFATTWPFPVRIDLDDLLQ